LGGQARPFCFIRPRTAVASASARRREAEASRDHHRRLAALHRVGDLLLQDAGKFLPGHAGPRHHAQALQEGRRAHHQHAVDPPLAHALEQQRDVEHHHRLAPQRRATHELALLLRHQRMDDRLEPAQRLLVAEHTGTQRLAVEHARLHHAGKPPRSAAGRGRRRLQAVDGGIGVVHRHAHLPQHLCRGRLAHADRAGESDDDHRFPQTSGGVADRDDYRLIAVPL
jgi:hypothetical protein